eukprot:9445556-Alexandrium_andersonii.AAC.1
MESFAAGGRAAFKWVRDGFQAPEVVTAVRDGAVMHDMEEVLKLTTERWLQLWRPMCCGGRLPEERCDQELERVLE